MKKSRRGNHLASSNTPLRTEKTHCPWDTSACQQFCQVCFHYCGVQHELDQCDVALDDFCKRLLSFAAGHDNDIGKIRKEINAIQKDRNNEN